MSRIAPPVIQEIFVNFSFMSNAPVRRALLAALALYRSAFAGVPTGVEQTRVDWKKANADVGQFKRGHADLLKWEREQAKAAQLASGSTPAPTR